MTGKHDEDCFYCPKKTFQLTHFVYFAYYRIKCGLNPRIHDSAILQLEKKWQRHYILGREAQDFVLWLF